MYDELVKRLREQIECDKKIYPQGAPFETLLLDLAADAIEELSMRLHGDEAAIAGMKREIERMVVSGNKPRWIPVTERLPREQETVLTWGKQGVILLDWRHDSKWCCFGDVTHWMPLPPVPGEEET